MSYPFLLLSLLLYLEPRLWQEVRTLPLGRDWPPRRHSRPVSLLTRVLGVWERWEGLARPEIGQEAGKQEAGAGETV